MYARTLLSINIYIALDQTQSNSTHFQKHNSEYKLQIFPLPKSKWRHWINSSYFTCSSMHVVASLFPPILSITIPSPPILLSLLVCLTKPLFYCNSKLSLRSTSMKVIIIIILMIHITLLTRRWNIGILREAIVIVVSGMVFLAI